MACAGCTLILDGVCGRCNLLIRDGAHPVLDPADLIAELELTLGPPEKKVEPETIWPWEGISSDRLANSQGLTTSAAAATLSWAQMAGALVRRGNHYFPAPASR